ncbi:hypothetical protein [Conexibacter woesei]|uniref:hypothetical protein n=1 Tax=Conexibacter woesei TaxID=191495 RepID=UPI0012DD0E41|nr:hypothetical protein [Conexibacter woesei]
MDNADRAGRNTARWNGKLNRKALKPGSYRLVATARTRAGVRGAAKTKAFRVRR